jgi:hypothetical protein
VGLRIVLTLILLGGSLAMLLRLRQPRRLASMWLTCPFWMGGLGGHAAFRGHPDFGLDSEAR